MLEEMIIHAITSLALLVLVYEFCRGVRRPPKRALMMAISIVLLLGIYKEYMDKMDGNYFDWFDMTGNVIGIFIGYLINRK